MPFPSRRVRITDTAPKYVLNTSKDSSTYDGCYSDLFGRRLSRSASPDLPKFPSVPPPFPVDGPIINRLPNEVLCEIFNAGRYGIAAREGLWLLKISSVCQRWRTVATRTPSLWSHIYFGEHMLSTHYTDACITRSQNCPLEITIRPTDIFHYRIFDHHMRRIIEHSARWRSLDLQTRDPTILRLIISQMQKLGQLVQVTISQEPGDNADPRDLIFIYPADVEAPRLTKITLCGVSFLTCNMPSNHVTSLTLTRTIRALTSGEFKRILMAASSLKRLSLPGDVAILDRQDWFTIRIPSLVSLTLFSSSESAFEHLCNTIVAPTLQILALHYCTRECIRLLIDSCRLSSPKYPELRSLEIRTLAVLDLILIDIVDMFDELASIDNFSMIAFHSQAFMPLWPLLYCGHWENLVPEKYHLRTELSNHISHGPDYSYQSDASVIPDWLRTFGGAIQPNPDRRVYLPNLRTITVSSLDRDNQLQACILAMSRFASGLPLAAVRAYSMNGSLSVQEFLKQCINVELIR